MTRRAGRLLSLCAVHLAILSLGACVTEQRPLRSNVARCIPRTETRHPAAPLVTPVPGAATVRTHVRLAVRPLGSIEYDGQVLPLVSPDGAHIAASTGASPSWPALLGEPGASPPAGARLVIYDINTGAHADVPNSDAIAHSEPSIRRAHEVPHAALVLGRSTDERGFLVESPRPDGARWIGFAHWDTGSLDWLIRDDAVNAHATLASNGALAFTRRKDANSPPELVFIADNTHELTWTPDTRATEVIAPAFSAANQLYAFVIHHEDTRDAERGIELLAFTLTDTGLTVESRIHLAASTNPLWIHQALAPINGWHGTPSRDAGWHGTPSRDASAPHSPPPPHPGLTFFHPTRRNIVTWRPPVAPSSTANPVRPAPADTLLNWADGSVAWAPVAPTVAPTAAAASGQLLTRGAFLTTTDGLVYQPDPSENRTNPDQALARALATSGIPRATLKSAQFLLLAPDPAGRTRVLDLFEFGIRTGAADEENAPSRTP